jgi:hypothetical protein
VGGWEAALGTHDLAGKTAVILPDLGTARVRSEVADVVTAAAETLAVPPVSRLVDVRSPPCRPCGAVGHGRPAQ